MIDERIPITYEQVCELLGVKLGTKIPRKIKTHRWLGEKRYWRWSVEEFINLSWQKGVTAHTFANGEKTAKQPINLKLFGGTLSRKEQELEQRIQATTK